MVALGVDHVGSVLLSMDQWQDSQLHAAVQRVQISGCKSSLIPLFGDTDAISRAVDYYRPDILHLCETLPSVLHDPKGLNALVSLQRTIKERYPEVEIMRSIPIGQDGKGDAGASLKLAALFEPWSDWFLTDTLIVNDNGYSDHEQPVTGFVGITGKRCDWDVARKLVEQSRIPVILAGGIGPENVARGITHVMPAGVDSCTLTNAVGADGSAHRFKKDPEKVRKMIQNARKAVDDR